MQSPDVLPTSMVLSYKIWLNMCSGNVGNL